MCTSRMCAFNFLKEVSIHAEPFGAGPHRYFISVPLVTEAIFLFLK